MFSAYTMPRYQVSVYRTFGPLVVFVIQTVPFAHCRPCTHLFVRLPKIIKLKMHDLHIMSNPNLVRDSNISG